MAFSQHWEIYRHAQNDYFPAKSIRSFHLWSVYRIPDRCNFWRDRYARLLVADALGNFLAHWLNFDAFDSDRFISKSGQKLNKNQNIVRRDVNCYYRVVNKLLFKQRN